jgi:hypothetical protein
MDYPTPNWPMDYINDIPNVPLGHPYLSPKYKKSFKEITSISLPAMIKNQEELKKKNTNEKNQNRLKNFKK